MAQTEIASVECARCGTMAFAGARYCSDCGKRLGPSADAAAAMWRFVSGTAREAGRYGRSIAADPKVRAALENPVVQKVAAGAVVGAALAAVVPFVTMGVGAVAGGGVVAVRRIVRRGR